MHACVCVCVQVHTFACICIVLVNRSLISWDCTKQCGYLSFSLLLPLVWPPSLIASWMPLLIFLFSVSYHLYPSITLPRSTHLWFLWSFYSFLASVFMLWCIFKSDDLQLGTMNEKEMWWFFFWTWVTLLILIFSWSTHLTENLVIQIFSSWIVFHLSRYHIFTIHLSAEGYFYCFPIPAIVNKAAVNIAELVPVEWKVESFGYIPSVYIHTSGIAGSYDNFSFSFLRILHNYFQIGCISFHSHQQWMRVSLSPQFHWHLFHLFCWCQLFWQEWDENLKKFQFCFSLISKNDEDFLGYFWAIFVSSVENSPLDNLF